MTPGRQKEFDRDQALDRAMEHFWQHGYAASSLSDLLRAMGISRQSLYDTFGSKRDLFIHAIEHYRETQLTQALALLEREASPLENVKDVLRFFETLAADARCRGCFVANALVEMSPHDEEITRVLDETLAALRGAIEAALELARARGELSPAKSPTALALALTNAMVGLAVTGRLPVPPETLHQISTGTLALLD
jgi:TetR/AcrR family transcriptional repressor of nem operon